VSQTCIIDTKRTSDDFRITIQTTPVPLRGTSPPDLRRGVGKTSNLQVDSHAGAYARLKSPAGTATIAPHVVEPGQAITPKAEGVRLYFEVKGLDAFCKALARKGVKFDQMPKDMPWGWRHAYLRDPDGREISLYWAGEARFKKTVVQ
jgi:uncharacterized glyoxalase superfamily protein PhnB